MLPSMTNAAAPAKPGAKLEEVTVTARRREESAQETPVALSVLNAEQLYTAGIKEIRDLTASVPGVNMTSSGATINTVFSIRGRSRSVVGNMQPSVATYVNEVPLSIWGASIPTYDISSIQVLKGPQGTLFGRNTTTGAVLVTTTQPTHSFGGYIQGTLGKYHWQQYEGALNVPILQDKIALRVSGQLTDRDGYTKNMSGGKDFDDMNRDNYRVSLLLEPIESLKNTTVYERNKVDEVGAGLVFYKYSPPGAVDSVPYYNGTLRTITGAVPGPTFPGNPNDLIPTGPACNGDPACDISAAAARQRAAGPRKAWTDVDPFIEGDLESWSNTTTFDLGAVTLKNIFGYREVYFHNISDIDGLEMSQINADSLVDNKQLTEEFQVAGTALDDKLQYIAGYFYSKAEANGPQRLAIQQFAVSGTPMDSPAAAPFNGAYGSGDYYTDTSHAVFAQVSYDFSALISGLSLDLGMRRTKDEQEVCDVAFEFFGNPPLSESECNAAVGTNPTVSFNKTDFSKTTYSIGLNYKITDDILVYGIHRTGYRAGGINTPRLGGSLTSFQNYEPEEVQDFELGVKSDWLLGDMPARLNAAIYQSKFDEVQAGIAVASTVQGSNPPDPGPDGDFNPVNDPANNSFYANAGEATVTGIEIETALRPLDELELLLAGTYLDKQLDKVASGLPVSEASVNSVAFIAAPRFSYSLSAAYTLPLDGLGDLRFNAKYFRTSDIQYGTVDAPAWERTDLRVDLLNIAESGLDIGAFVTNVFDKDAVIAPSSSSEGLGVNSAIYNEPRMIGVQARYQFGNK